MSTSTTTNNAIFRFDPTMNTARQALYRYTALAMLDPRSGSWSRLSLRQSQECVQAASELMRAAEELASRITDLRSRLVAPQSERSDFPSKIGALKTTIWGSTSLPTGAQMRNVDELGKELEKAVNDANSEISVGMPQLYKALADSNLYVTPPRIKEIGTSSRSPPQ